MDALLPTPCSRLLPQPRLVSSLGEIASVSRECQVALQCEDPRVTAEWERLRACLPKRDSSGRGGIGRVWIGDQRSGCGAGFRQDTGAKLNPQGYRLRIGSDEIELLGGSAAACYYGLQTLRQLLGPPAVNWGARDIPPAMNDGARAGPRAGALPVCLIEDEPDFATRGLLHDVTRGKSPKLDTLKLLANRLAAMKVNQLQLYIEHAFVFSFDPEICGPDEGLTPDEIRDLDTYCRERFIDLVPAVATLGHMGRILSMPAYRNLAEIEGTRPWERMNWLERMRGFTLDVLNPESRDLVSRIWSDILDAFSSPIVNICGDEPWDLGRGKNADRLDTQNRGEAYVDHIRFTHDLCAARDRRSQLWGDVVRNYPHLLSRLPPDLTVLHWGYDDKADYVGTGLFVNAGLETIVCPGTSGWKRIINAMDAAERNITSFAKCGKQFGASGLLNTDWGDFGHFNSLACSWHGIALGAAVAWNTSEPGGADFDRRFAAILFGSWSDQDHGEAAYEWVTQLRRASAIGEACETWLALFRCHEDPVDSSAKLSGSEIESACEAAERARAALCAMVPADEFIRDDLRELSLACDFTEIMAQRIHPESARVGRVNSAPGPNPSWIGRLADATDRYAAAWLARNKSMRLCDITEKLVAIRPGPQAGRNLKSTAAYVSPE